MAESLARKIENKKGWAMAPEAFDRLLLWLDEGTDSSGLRYLEMRRRLEAYFDRKNCMTPEDLADETLNRVARRLEEEGEITGETPARYCYIVARFVFMEHLRSAQRQTVSLDEITHQPSIEAPPREVFEEAAEEREKMLDCLDQCTLRLTETNQNIIRRYYVGEERVKIENRRSLADTLGISMNALSIRACRIRDKLEECVNQCISFK